MTEPPSAPAAILPSPLVESTLAALVWILAVLALSAGFGVLRAALHSSLPARVLARARHERRRVRLTPLLERAEVHATSAAILKTTCDLVFVALLIGVTAEEGSLDWPHLALALGIAAPALLLLTELLPTSIGRAWGDRLLARALPTFHVLQLPVAPLSLALHAVRRAVLRTVHIDHDDESSRKLVEGLREVVRGSSPDDELEESERALIENVMEFGDVDAAAVMTPRTEIHAVSADASLEQAVAVLSEAGHSRIPVYGEGIDNIIGTVTALEVARALTAPDGHPALRDLLRPPLLVPETKRVQELLAEFQTAKQKMAVVLDEYGGTAGIVTLTDVLEELVGEIQDEFADQQETIRQLDGGLVEVQAGLHVSEVNEALGLAIPEEEDFETLGGFVLAELGHFPRPGESFRRGEVTYSVAEASDRRVYKVRVQRSA